MMARLVLLLACLALSGCATLSALGRASETLDVHEIRAPGAIQARPARGVQMVVELPATSGAIDTDRIVVRTGPTEVTYLPDARWSASAPEMLQSAMVEALLATEAYSFVGRRPLSASGDLALVSTLTDFGATVAPGQDSARVTMTLRAQIVRESDARILARRTFQRSAMTPDTSSGSIIAGYADVSEAVLTDLAAWAPGAP